MPLQSVGKKYATKYGRIAFHKFSNATPFAARENNASVTVTNA